MSCLLSSAADDNIKRTSDMQYMVEIKSRFLDRYGVTDVVLEYSRDVGGDLCAIGPATMLCGEGTGWERYQDESTAQQCHGHASRGYGRVLTGAVKFRADVFLP